METPAGVKCVASGKLPRLNDAGESSDEAAAPSPPVPATGGAPDQAAPLDESPARVEIEAPAPAYSSPPRWRAGALVEARFCGMDEWYPGRVVRVAEDGAVDNGRRGAR